MQVEISPRTKFSDLAPSTQKALRRLTVPRWILRSYIDGSPEELFTNVAYYRGKIVGWMALRGNLALFYVRPSFRRMGIGTLLANRVNRTKHKSQTGIHGSDKFFKNNRIKYSSN